MEFREATEHIAECSQRKRNDDKKFLRVSKGSRSSAGMFRVVVGYSLSKGVSRSEQG